MTVNNRIGYSQFAFLSGGPVTPGFLNLGLIDAQFCGLIVR